MCRAGAFPLKDRISLGRLGLDDHVGVTAIRTAGGPAMTTRVWSGLVAMDLIRQLHLYHLAAERTPGESERLYRCHAEAVLAILGEPGSSGVRGAAHLASQWQRLGRRLDLAAADFAALEARRSGPPLPSVFLSGDILTKGTDFANGGLCQALARRGVRVVLEPTCDFLEFLGEAHPALLFGHGATAMNHLPYRLAMVTLRDALYAHVTPQHPFLPRPDLARVLARTDALLDRRTVGGSALTVGSALHHHETGAADGVVLVACWGCDNGVIAENLLRQRRDLPALYFYDDGTPLDERRLDRFVFQLRRHVAERGTRTAAPARRRMPHRLERLSHVLDVR